MSASHARILIIGFALAASVSSFGDEPPDAPPPAISTLLKPAIYSRMLKEREVMVYADLKDRKDLASSPGKEYSFYAAMLVNANPKQTRKVLTDYPLYADIIPFVEKADYDSANRVLSIVGGIWKYQMSSRIRFEEKGERWITFEVISGHFTGMRGDAFFESLADRGTAVYFRGNLTASTWPPAFVVEKGAEIVFEFTGRRMRSYIETKK